RVFRGIDRPSAALCRGRADLTRGAPPMTDLTPFEDLLRGHAGLLADSTHDRWIRAQALFEDRSYREAAVLLRDLIDEAEDVAHGLTDVRLLLARALFHSAQLD